MVLHFLGFILLVIGGVMIIPAALSPVFGETYLAPAFILPALIALLLGFFLRRSFKPAELTLGKAMVMVTFAWIIFSAFSSVPYVFGNEMPVEDAYFESMSGFTATGLTMIPGDPIANDIVISEVGMDSNGRWFIELYNPTGFSIDLRNLRGENLRIWAVDPFDNVSPLNVTWDNTIIPAHGYFLLASDGVVDNISVDASFIGVMENSSGVIIDDDSDPLDEAMDKVGWGSGTVESATEGTKIPHDLRAATSIERKAVGRSTSRDMRERDRERGNGYDTNNNSRDFVFHPDFYGPGNSSSSPEIPIRNIEATSRTILFWRSLTEWVGGMGVIVLFLAALVGFGKAARKMYVAEARAQMVEPSIRQTARSLWKVYVILTILGVFLLYFAGQPSMTLFEAVNHSMTGIATGGFSVRNESFATYGAAVLAITILIMILGATSFAVHLKVFKGNWREFFSNVEVRLMLVLIFIITLLLVWSVGFGHSLFQSTSALTGTGFSTTSLGEWGDAQKGSLTLLMIIGGGYGSTSSAIKLIRVIILGKAIHWMIKRSFLPDRAILPMKVAGRTYTEREMMETAIYALIYIIVLIFGAAILIGLGNAPMDSIFESASAQGNVGLSVGITSALMPLEAKIVMIVQMLVGRLEIIPVIAFFSYLVAKVPRPSRKPF
jgi:trk system potassium uptake protein TrkH